MSLSHNECPAGQPCPKPEALTVRIVMDTMNVILVKLLVIEVRIGLYPNQPFSMTLATFQGHNGVKQLKIKVVFLRKLLSN